MRSFLTAVLLALGALTALAAQAATGLGQAPAFEHAKGDALEVIGRVHFPTGSAALSPRARGILVKLATQLGANPGQKLEIAGHADGSGAEGFNQVLSERRANSVGQFLAAHGVDGARLSTIGYGPFVPVAPNDTDAGRARNRRVEIKVSP